MLFGRIRLDIHSTRRGEFLPLKGKILCSSYGVRAMIEDIRKSYELSALTEAEAGDDPFALLAFV